MANSLIFMGTGPFALCALEGLFRQQKPGDTLIVYTKEAKKAGRGMKEKDGCVAEFARENGLPLYQPHSLREEAAEKEFLQIRADLAIVASYGLILPSYVLKAPRCGCVNIHASLLPRYRGAAPIQRVILDGEVETGVTLMQMDEGLDTGDILLQRTTPISDSDTAGDLFDRLAVMGRDMLLEYLPSLLAGEIHPIPQNHSKSTYAAKITAEDQKLDFQSTQKKLLGQIRGLSPVPSAFCRTQKDGKLLKIHAAHAASWEGAGEPGEIVSVKPQVLVRCADGVIALDVVQPEGKGKMNASDAVNGRRLSVGEFLI